MLRNINRPTLAQLVERLTVDVTNLIWKKSNQIVACSIQASRNILFNMYFKILINYLLTTY